MTALTRIVGEPTVLATQEEVRTTIQATLIKYAEAIRHCGLDLVGFAQFGSTVRSYVPTETDIDLLIICESVPKERRERYAIFDRIEAGLEAELRPLQAKGYWLQFSTIVRTRSEALRFSQLYMDMTIDVNVVASKDRFVEDLLRRTKDWLERHEIRRHSFGLKWYWAATSGTKDAFDPIDW